MKSSNNCKELVAPLLQKVFKGRNGKISSIRDIHLGYTNQSYLVTFTNKKKYQVRFPHCGDLINRRDEYKIISMLKNINFVYFDAKTGIAVKEWIPGKNPKVPFFHKWKYADKLFEQINQLHALKLPSNYRFKKIDYDTYNKNLYRLKLIYQAKFLNIVDSIANDPVVLSHTDINAQNIVMDNQHNIHLIDYEWCNLTNDYWDYANFIRESRITWWPKIDWKKYIKDFDMQKMKEIIFACSVYAFLWAWTMPATKRIIKYRKKTLRQVRHYARGVIRNDE